MTLFASGDSVTAAELVPCAPQGLRLAGFRDHTGSLLVMLSDVRERADEFDMIHFHVEQLQVPLFYRASAQMRLDPARPPRHAGLSSGLQSFSENAAGLDLG